MNLKPSIKIHQSKPNASGMNHLCICLNNMFSRNILENFFTFFKKWNIFIVWKQNVRWVYNVRILLVSFPYFHLIFTIVILPHNYQQQQKTTVTDSPSLATTATITMTPSHSCYLCHNCSTTNSSTHQMIFPLMYYTKKFWNF